jgi:hypothetical protein
VRALVLLQGLFAIEELVTAFVGAGEKHLRSAIRPRVRASDVLKDYGTW